jgi:signal transduction histidine kinase
MKKLLAILIIDDDKGDRIACHRMLKTAFAEKLEFMEAENGEKGLEAIEKYIPDCVLLDHLMPGIDGIEVLKRIRIKHPYLAVVMIDGKGNDVFAVQAMKEGAQDYIAKRSITPPIMQRVVQMAVEHSALQKRSHAQRASLEIFTRALAHDLKEPLRTMRSYLDQITDRDRLSQSSQQFFHYISKATDRMNTLVDVVHLYMRLDAVEQMEKSFCRMSGILEEVEENLALLIETRGATITCGRLPRLNTNPVQMRQLFENLLANSIRHCESPVTIHVSAEEHKDHWQFTVSDNGPGIAAEQLQKIFDPFKRLSHSEGSGQGLGLGLAINRKIVESQGGKIWCESKQEIGTSFIFTLPKVMASSAVKRGVSVQAPLVNSEATSVVSTLGRVLLVDDNNLDIQLTRMVLEHARFRCEILTARDGKEALTVLQNAKQESNPIDLVLLDINMPVMSGFELLAKMHQEHMLLDTLVVMCSTSSSDLDKRSAESLGATGYLVKPPQILLLKNIIAHSKHLRMYHEGDDDVLRRVA